WLARLPEPLLVKVEAEVAEQLNERLLDDHAVMARVRDLPHVARRPDEVLLGHGCTGFPDRSRTISSSGTRCSRSALPCPCIPRASAPAASSRNQCATSSIRSVIGLVMASLHGKASSATTVQSCRR